MYANANSRKKNRVTGQQNYAEDRPQKIFVQKFSSKPKMFLINNTDKQRDI